MRDAGSREAASGALLYRICSILLRYPDDEVLGLLDDVDAALPALPAADAAPLRQVLAWMRTTPAMDLAAHYVTTFDTTRRRSLYLTYYRHGDTRARGMALLAVKHVYRQAGHEPPDRELPDFLPMVLEFAALAPGPGAGLLEQCRPGLELLRRALDEAGSPYRYLLDAVCDRLPGMSPRLRAQLARLAKDGPPVEHVGLERVAPGGLEPFGPPEFVAGRQR